jgi:hypothetical protein
VLRVADLPVEALQALLRKFELRLVVQPQGATIKGSFWGDSEAGIAGSSIYVRPDTPIHSMLHETCHVICMTPERRSNLHTDAGGDDLEEAAVCYLQILLAAEIEGVGSARLMQDMDSWGYSFRLGSTARWFAEDAEDALQWLQDKNLVGARGEARFRLRASV